MGNPNLNTSRSPAEEHLQPEYLGHDTKELTFRDVLQKRLSPGFTYEVSESRLGELDAEHGHILERKDRYDRMSPTLPDGSRANMSAYNNVIIELEENEQESVGNGKGVLNLGTYKKEDVGLVFSNVEPHSTAALFVKHELLPLIGNPSRIKSVEDRYVTIAQVEKKALDLIETLKLPYAGGDGLKCEEFLRECFVVVKEKEQLIDTEGTHNENLKQTLRQAHKLLEKAKLDSLSTGVKITKINIQSVLGRVSTKETRQTQEPETIKPPSSKDSTEDMQDMLRNAFKGTDFHLPGEPANKPQKS